jgi:hypothetical protein
VSQVQVLTSLPRKHLQERPFRRGFCLQMRQQIGQEATQGQRGPRVSRGSPCKPCRCRRSRISERSIAGHVLAAEMAARDMGGLSLSDALLLCELLANTDPAPYERAALRWPRAVHQRAPAAAHRGRACRSGACGASTRPAKRRHRDAEAAASTRIAQAVGSVVGEDGRLGLRFVQPSASRSFSRGELRRG